MLCTVRSESVRSGPDRTMVRFGRSERIQMSQWLGLVQFNRFWKKIGPVLVQIYIDSVQSGFFNKMISVWSGPVQSGLVWSGLVLFDLIIFYYWMLFCSRCTYWFIIFVEAVIAFYKYFRFVPNYSLRILLSNKYTGFPISVNEYKVQTTKYNNKTYYYIVYTGINYCSNFRGGQQRVGIYYFRNNIIAITCIIILYHGRLQSFLLLNKRSNRILRV